MKCPRVLGPSEDILALNIIKYYIKVIITRIFQKWNFAGFRNYLETKQIDNVGIFNIETT